MPTFSIIWEFIVRPAAAAEFVRHYGPDGSWAQLFRAATGYIDTRLLRDHDRPDRFVTIDRWSSEEAFRQFRSERAAEYEALDRACESLTVSERELGRFDEVC